MKCHLQHHHLWLAVTGCIRGGQRVDPSGPVTYSQNVNPSVYQVVATSGGVRSAGADLFVMSLSDSGGTYQVGDMISGGG